MEEGKKIMKTGRREIASSEKNGRAPIFSSSQRHREIQVILSLREPQNSMLFAVFVARSNLVATCVTELLIEPFP